MSNDPEASYGDARLLWGRIAVLLAVLLLVFFLGRWSVGDSGATEQELADANARVAQLESEVRSLEAQLQAEAAGGVGGADAQGEASPGVTPGQDATPEPEATQGDAAVPTGQDAATANRTYEVQEGDTLISIAQQFYDDPEAWQQIAELNNLSEDNALTVGTVLQIPPEN